MKQTLAHKNKWWVFTLLCRPPSSTMDLSENRISSKKVGSSCKYSLLAAHQCLRLPFRKGLNSWGRETRVSLLNWCKSCKVVVRHMLRFSVACVIVAPERFCWKWSTKRESCSTVVDEGLPLFLGFNSFPVFPLHFSECGWLHSDPYPLPQQCHWECSAFIAGEKPGGRSPR